MFPITLLQLLIIGILITQIGITIAAMLYLRRLKLSPNALLLWDVIVLCVPTLGPLLVLITYPPGRRR